MNIRFLGTNGWYDTQTGNTICVLLEDRDRYLIFDAGNGLYKAGSFIRHPKPVQLFLSHYHLDHVIGLHALAKFKFRQGLDIYGPPGLRALFRDVINRPYTIPLSGLSMRVRLHELKMQAVINGGVSFAPLKHSSACYGYRVVSEGRVVTYCTDTGICRNLDKLARGADLLIAECSLRSYEFNRSWPHLNPQDAAKAALKAKVGRLALLHFDANLYPRIKDRYAAQASARRIFKKTFACMDGMSVRL
jgi:ribonuclease BN (tRNA processing enzyme)